VTVDEAHALDLDVLVEHDGPLPDGMLYEVTDTFTGEVTLRRTPPRPSQFVAEPDTGRVLVLADSTSTVGGHRVRSYGYDRVKYVPSPVAALAPRTRPRVRSPRTSMRSTVTRRRGRDVDRLDDGDDPPDLPHDVDAAEAAA
jgi:hypothetical protein